MTESSDIAAGMKAVSGKLMARILTQVCRDPNSPAYGSFDRNWWHYKIRDFSSIILQQGGYACYLAGRLPDYEDHAASLNGMAAAACIFWNHRATKFRAFEEYYPWESGYPPLAFSTLGVMKLVADGVVSKQDVEAGARIAARQLVERFESKAANQQVAGLAGLAWLKKVYPEIVSEALFAQLKEKVASLQYEEGWFEEYGGPDLGYLSVTLDCLWDLFDATQDVGFVQMAEKAMDFLGTSVLAWGDSLGMHNSRNTDYIVPYGPVRFVHEKSEKADMAQRVLTVLYKDVDSPFHFIQSIDDRYLCHYVGASVIRAASLLDACTDDVGRMEANDGPVPFERLYERAGLFLLRTKEQQMVMSFNKGGVLSLKAGTASAADMGWIMLHEGKQYVSHWWSSSRWTWKRDGCQCCVEGSLVPTKEPVSSPFKHMVLRGLSFLFGRKLIGLLKGRLIFNEESTPFIFKRIIEWGDSSVVVRDTIEGVPTGARIIRAPRTSKRHVASADSFHSQDLTLVANMKRIETISNEQALFRAETRYSPGDHL